MSDVVFIDNSIAVKEALGRFEEQFLTEAAMVIKEQAKQNTAVDTHHTKESWDHIVDTSKHEAVIGNPLENAVWEEFGTGEYALEKKGSGWWVYVKGEKSQKHIPKRYTEAKAKQIVAILRKKGFEAYCTKGKRPRRALHKAFETKKSAVIRRAQQLAKEEFK